ncbi:MAG: Smr/MutS family protein [Hyphococcus sp.]
MRKRTLSSEERALWRRALRDVTPLDSQSADIVANAHDREVPLGVSEPLPAHRRTLLDSTSPSRPAAPTADDVFRSGDPRFDRHVRRGRMAIDGVLDLHGHTQASARAALLRFLAHARAQNHRCVLVITGKGGGVRGAVRQGAGRGVLRARFRDWMHEGPFREHVARASAAHAKHGGDGAFYVFLKRRRPSGNG